MHTKPDVTWDYFDVLRLSGEEATFSIVRFQGEKPLEKLRYDHRDYDGISAICEIARKLPAETFQAPNLQIQPKPSLFKQFLLLIVWCARVSPGIGKSWLKNKGLYLPSSAFISITKNEAANLKYSTADFLEALDRTAQPYLRKSLLPRLWMIPVGLYPQINRELPPLNRVSFVDVKLWNHSTTDKINSGIKRDLRSGLYWGSLLTLYTPRLLGKINFVFLLKVLHHFFRRTGTLTNLGQWTMKTQEANEWWAVDTTVVRISPVAASMIEINGCIGLGIQFHPSLRWTQSDAQKFMAEWKNNLLSQSH